LSALLFELSAAPGLALDLCRHLGWHMGAIERRQFPDRETYVRLRSPVRGKEVVLLCTLDNPDSKLSLLIFAAEAARAQGACRVGLVAPYLAYLRQDAAFRTGEAVTSATFAKILSEHVDWLATLDPHLHRYRTLGEIYSIPSIAGTAAKVIGEWVRANVELPIIVGPDEESQQWAEAIASVAAAPFTVLRKTRTGDQSVSIDDTSLRQFDKGTALVVADIASTAGTMIEAVKLLRSRGIGDPICAVVHPIFAGDAYQRLAEAGPGRIVSTNSIEHETNVMDVSRALAETVAACRLGDSSARPPVP
jgi:ribose-phosphate pyrophosphokinase